MDCSDTSINKEKFFKIFNNEFQNRFIYEDIKKVYNIGKEIGSGKYGVVKLVAKKSYDKKRFALKSIPRAKINADI